MLFRFFTFPHTLLLDTAIVFAVGLLFAVLARKFRQSPLIGYLLAGLLIGPYGLALIPNERNIMILAEVGVVLLMFALGVQLTIRQLLEVKTTAIVGGLVQIVICILLGMAIGWIAKLPISAGIVLGYALALSSSVVLVKLLGDRNEFHTLFGRTALAISIMQDLSAVLLISTLPFLQPATVTSYAALSLSLLKAFLFILWILLLARFVAPYILKWASSTGSREIFLPTVVVLSLGGAIMSAAFGFSYALGAFLAGIVISESLFSQAVLAEVLPLRDLFGLLFFVSLGMLVDPTQVWAAKWFVLALLLAAIVFKPLLITWILMLFRTHPYIALMVGFCLGQVGEFSFIIGAEAFRLGVIDAGISSIILSVAIISIALTPMILPGVRRLYRTRHPDAIRVPCVEETEETLTESEPAPVTVLLCGYGRVGRTITQALDTFRIPFMVVDINRQAIEALRLRGIRAVYGDATNTRLLDSIGAIRYRLGVIAVSEQEAVRVIATYLQRVNPRMQLLLRSHTDWETAEYLQMGVDDVVHVELEASLAFVQKVLQEADVDRELLLAYLDDIREGYYEGLRPRDGEENQAA